MRPPLLRIGVIIILFLSCQSQLIAGQSKSESTYQLALKQIGDRDFSTALKSLHSCIREDPDFADAYRVLVELQIYMDNIKDAKCFFDSILVQNPRNPYAFYALARIDQLERNYDEAIQKLKHAITLNPYYAEAYGHRGGLPEVYRAKKDLNAGVEFFEVLIRQDSSNSLAYFGLARCYARQGKWDKTLTYLSRATDLDPNLTLAYYSFVYIYGKTNDSENQRRYCQFLLDKAVQDGDLELAAYAYNSIGGLHYDNGNYMKALDAFNSALEWARKSGSLTREARIFNNTASIYANLGNYDKALMYFGSALDLYQRSGVVVSEVRTLTNMASVYKDMEKYEQAIEYYDKAIALSNSLSPRNAKERKSLIYSNMAEIYEKERHFVKARELLISALAMARELGYESRQGFVLRNIGRVYEGQGEPDTAQQYYQQSLEIGINNSTIQLIWESFAGLASTFESLGDKQKAIDYYGKTISIYETVRNELGIAALGSSFLEDKYEAYPSIVRLLAQSGKPDLAFENAEKYKANNILDIVSPNKSRLDEILSDGHRKQISEIANRLLVLNAQKSAETSKLQQDTSLILELDQEIADLQLQKVKALDELRSRHPDAFITPYSEISQVSDVQGVLRSNNQALVEYIMGPSGLSVFVVTADTLVYSLLPVKREDLKDMMAKLSPIFSSDANAAINDREEIVNHELANFTLSPAAELYEAIFKPIEKSLAGIEDLVIVPDDVLHYLPFEMLIADTSDAITQYDFANARFLIEDYNICYNSAASQIGSSSTLPGPPSSGILAMGNPDFDNQADEEYAYELQTANLAYSGNVVRGKKLVSLPDSEKEVRSIVSKFGKAMSNVFTGRDATEANFRQYAGSSKILHFATHFLANDNYPLYSKIVLARDDNAQDDGYLQAYEIFAMKLNAELAVLSACNSGLGMLRRGEGLIGISKAFQNSGVGSQVVSLWNVNDKTTPIIMNLFYENLESGLSMSRALRMAKLTYMKDAVALNKDPFYWAPFVLIGDDKTVDISNNEKWPDTAFLFMAAFALLIIPFTFYRHRNRKSC